MTDSKLNQRIKSALDSEIASEIAVKAQKDDSKRVQYELQLEVLTTVLEAFQSIRDEVLVTHKIPCKCFLSEEKRFVEIFLDARDPAKPNSEGPILFFLVTTEANGLESPMLFLGGGSRGSHRVASIDDLLDEVIREIGKFVATLNN